MFNSGTSKSPRPSFQVTSRQSKRLAISLVSVLLCCLLFYVSEYRVKWSGKKKNRTREHSFYADRTVTEVNCKAITNGDEFELKKADLLHNVSRNTLQPEDYIKMTQNCPQFVLERGYITEYLTELENIFSIAFSLLMFQDVEQAERWLRAIYRPQNFYCIHVDAKSDDSIYSAMQGVASCFENVHVLTTRVDVKWGNFSVLEPELLCMDHLWKRSASWRYFINLTGQEFLLRTNYELVRILQAYKGANDVSGTVNRSNRGRWATAGPPPHGITPVKGSVHVVVQRGFVDHVMHDARVADLLNWTRRVAVPDETFFSTLNHNPSLGIPGAYKGLPETERLDDIVPVDKPFVARFKNWGDFVFNWPCHGKRVRGICVFGVRDVPLLVQRKELFANKFHLDFHPLALDCLEEWHLNRTRDQYIGRVGFDVRWYDQLGFTRNKLE